MLIKKLKKLSKIEVKKYLEKSKSVEEKKNKKIPPSRDNTKTQDLKINDLIQVYNQLQHLFPNKDMNFMSEGKAIDLGGTFDITGVEKINILESYLKEYFKQERNDSHKRKVFRVWVNKNNTVGISTKEELNTRKNRDKNTKMQINFFVIDSE